MPRMSTQVLGGFKTGMDRTSKRGGRDGAQRLYTLQNAYLNERGEAVPRPGLAHVANVAHSSGLYGWQGQLHVFHGESDFVDPGNPLVAAHWVRYPFAPPAALAMTGDVLDGAVGDPSNITYAVSGGVTPYGSHSITAGALPPGLSMDALGQVSGAYTTTGSYAWTVSVTDADGTTVTVNDACTVTGVRIASLNFNSTLTADPTGTTWTVDSATITDRWGGQPVVMPVVSSLYAKEGSGMMKTPDTTVHDGSSPDYWGNENLGVRTVLGANAFGTSVDFCVELYVRLNVHWMSGGGNESHSFLTIETASGRFTFGARLGTPADGGPLENTVQPTGLTNTLWTPPTILGGPFFHIAVTRTGDLLACWYNGVKYAEYSGASTLNIDATKAIVVGNGENAGGTTLGWAGQFDDVRITRGWARYSATFTPPTVPY